jgi:cellobiose phosphorylase
MPETWPGYTIHYRFRQTVYHITIRRVSSDSGEETRLIVDGRNMPGNTVPLQDDHQDHVIEMTVC